jgi:hypothetical protein
MDCVTTSFRTGPSIRRGFKLSAFLIAIALSLATLCPAVFAQSGAGSIQGTVKDPTGAVIPSAAITVTNRATNVKSTTTSNSVGFYQVPGLFTGTYTVSVTARGMKTYNRSIKLLVDQTAVINPVMTAGSVTQQVTVSANAVQLVDTTNGTITGTLDNARINQLPMNGRNIISLVNETTPGLESCPESGSCANGEPGPATEYEVDGATLANREFGGVHEGSTQMVDPDSVQQVRVEDSNAGAQYASPTTVVLQSKSGTNQLHGTMFETARNNDFGIARTRSESSSYAQPEYIRNEFGASVGGPIVIPHLYHGKNKSFWFFAYERYSLAQVAEQDETTPTVAMRNGDFSGLVNKSGVTQELYDPNTTANNPSCPEPSGDGSSAYANPFCRTPFAYKGVSNTIDPARESPTAAVLNAMTPLPTNTENPLVEPNLVGLVPELQVEPQITFRLDHVFNQDNRAYLRYTQNISTSITPRNDPEKESYTLPASTPGGFKIPAGASGIAYDPDAMFDTALGFTHVFSPTLFSETIVSQTWMGEQNYAGGNPFLDYEAALGLPNDFGEKGFPYVASILQPMDGTMFQYGMTSRIFQIDENFTKTLGKHQLMFGGRYRFEHFGSRPDESKDTVNFDGLGTGLLNPSTYSSSAANAYSNSGDKDADEFIGSAYSYSNNLEPPYQHIHDMEIDGYFQDDYRVRNNLTLDLGLRWEAHPSAYMGDDMMGFDFKNDALVTSAPVSKLIADGLTTQAIITNDMNDDARFETPSQANLPSQLTYSYDANFLPRIGAAWQPFGHWGTVLRGGVARYLYPVPIREGYRDINRDNPFTAGYSQNYTSSQLTPHSNYLLLSQQNSSPTFNYNTTNASAGNGTPIMGVNSSGSVNSTTTTAIQPGIGIVTVDPHYAPSYMDEANFTVEQPTKWNSVVRLSYVYTRGGNLNNYFYYNAHPSEYSWEIQQGAETPHSSAIGPENSGTGEGPFDNLTWGDGSYLIQKTGWSNYNALQANFQKLYSHGSAWQIMYVWSKSMRTGDDYGGENGDDVAPYSDFVNSYVGNYVAAGPSSGIATPVGGTLIAPALPPPPPAGVPAWGYYKALNRWENYMIDKNNPPQHIQFNGILDLPFGRGKRFFGGVNKPVDEVLGGWQLAGAGHIQMTDFQITSSNWGPLGGALHRYKKGAPITDCRSGVCLKSYEMWNGYIPPTARSGNACSAGLSNVISGLPSGWQPYQTPVDTICSAPSGGKAVVDKYYGDNDVSMSNVAGQKNGTVIGYGIVPSAHNNGSSEGSIDVTNPFGHTVLDGPMNWEADLSLFKVFPIKERMNLRLNFDAFNVFNHQGTPNPSGSDGTVCVTPGGVGCSSANAGRELQFTGRFTF